MQNAAPSPVVEHLPTIFRKIRNGEYRVPPFQRGFVWEEKQVLELMESVYRGFPIGSILLWRVDASVFRSQKEEIAGFPEAPEYYPTNFILDGAQRLSSLNGVFAEGVSQDTRFRINFDLERETFFHDRDMGKFGVSVPLRSVFQPRAFINEQQRLAGLPEGDLFLERSVKLLAIFQEYMLPLVTIERKSAREVVDIFQRINSTGTPLGVVDFIRALTWSDDFDLTIELADLQARFEQLGFSFEEETLLKSLGIVLGLRPLPNTLLLLREKSAATLSAGVRALNGVLEQAISYVADGLGIASAEALPYEAQWLFLVRAIHDGVHIMDLRDEIVRWFKTSSLLETLQGRPDHALARMIDEMVETARANAWPVERSGNPDPITLLSKRFLRGKATSVAFVEMLLENGLQTQEELQVPLRAIPYEQFAPVLDRSELNKISRRSLNSARTIANVVYLPPGAPQPKSGGAEAFIKCYDQLSPRMPTLFLAQFVDDDFVSQLRVGNLEDTILRRAEAIGRYAEAHWVDRP